MDPVLLKKLRDATLSKLQQAGQAITQGAKNTENFIGNEVQHLVQPPLVSPTPQAPAPMNSIPYRLNQFANWALTPASTVQQFAQTPPKFNFAQNVKNPVAHFGAEFAQGAANDFISGLGGFARNVTDYRNGQLTPQRFIGNTAASAMVPLTFVGGGGAASEAGQALLKQGFKQAIKEGAITGAKQGLAFGALQGLNQNKDANSVPEQFLHSIPNALQGAAFGGVLGATGAGIANIPISAIHEAIKAFHPQVPNQEVTQAADLYLRDRAGRFIGAPTQFIGKTAGENKNIALGQGTIKINGVEMPRAEFNKKLFSELDQYFQDKIPQPGLSIKYTEDPLAAGTPGMPQGELPPQSLPSVGNTDQVGEIASGNPQGLNVPSNPNIPQTVNNRMGTNTQLNPQMNDQILNDQIQTSPNNLPQLSTEQPKLPGTMAPGDLPSQNELYTPKGQISQQPQQAIESGTSKLNIAPQELNVNRLDLNPTQKAH